MFEKLQTATGQQGAKKIMEIHPQDVISIPFEKDGIDIYTITNSKYDLIE